MINDELFSTCKKILDARFNRVIEKDENEDDSYERCIQDLYNVVFNKSWIGNLNILRIFDIRRINYIDVPDSLRTEWMLKLFCAYGGSLDWPIEKQKEVVSKIAILTVNRIISKLPGSDENIKNKCISAKTLEEAESAAYSADYSADAAAASAAYCAAYSAADAAASAADAAAYYAANAAYCAADAAARQEIFVETCKLWLEAAGC